MSLELVIVGDEAWTREEYEAEQNRLQRHREWKRRRYHSSPEVRERQMEYNRRWRADHLDQRRAYEREWARRKRLRLGMTPREDRPPIPRYVGSLHELRCTGPTKDTGCRCHKIRCYDKPR